MPQFDDRPRNRSREHRWAVLRTHTIGVGSPLLERTRILQTPLFGVYLHRHHRPDRERHLHDHPWAFTSLILRGGYVEEWAPSLQSAVRAKVLGDRWPDGTPRLGPVLPIDRGMSMVRAWNRGSWHRIRRGEFHSIRAITPGTVSLLVVGRRRSEWGFATEAGFVPAALYAYADPAAAMA